jgi:hypothetical protein
VTGLIKRTVFATPRAAEFLELRALQAQTGQPTEAFGAVVIKELIDNALDAAESAGVPPVIGFEVTSEDGITFVTVTDNGAGITPATVDDVCDFTVLASDKARYRGPSRGAQGNALKTLLGIPHVLGVTKPVVIDSAGVRHALRVYLDVAGEVVVEHDVGPGRTEGTAVTVPLPVEYEIDEYRWGFAAALVNPHAAITIGNQGYDDDEDGPEFYEPAGERWSKWTPSDRSSPHWYTESAFAALVSAYVREINRTGVDLALGAFIDQFEGLRGTLKQKAVRQAVPGISHVSQLAGRDNGMAALHTAMREHAKPTPPSRLGAVGPDRFQQLLNQGYGTGRFWYKKTEATVFGVPWIIEVALAETWNPCGVFYAVNHSPSFGDPLAKAYLSSDGVTGYGSTPFLNDSTLGTTSAHRGAVVHVICAAPQFVDKGKVALVLSAGVISAAEAALATATKVMRREAKQREKDAARADRAERNRMRESREADWTLKRAVFAVIPESRAAAIGERGRWFGARTMFYKVRKLIQAYTSRHLDFNYFSQDLCPQYERTVAEIEGMYYKGRGILVHPHDGRTILLGTREVDAYQLPEWEFDKILYVEKEGLDAQLAPYEIAQRYDMAMIFSEGYSVTACRRLLARFAATGCLIFVLHDGDIDGYNIGRTLAEATERMPDHNIEVIDLGLTVPQALDPNLPGAGGEPLPTETFTRQKELPSTVQFDPQALDWFTGSPIRSADGKRAWRGTRCELNAFSADGLAEFIEAQLEAHGAVGKLVPPDDVLTASVDDVRHDAVVELVKELMDIDGLAARVMEEYRGFGDIDEEQVRAWLTDNPTESWRAAVGQLVDDDIDTADGLTEAVRAQLAQQLRDTDEEEP